MKKRVCAMLTMFLLIFFASCSSGGNESSIPTQSNTSASTNEKYLFKGIIWADDYSKANIVLVSNLDESKAKMQSVSTSKKITKEPSCTENGVISYFVSFEGNTYSKDVELAKISHKFVETKMSPTFEEKGYTRHVCSVCGFYYDDSEVDVIPHHYSPNWSYDEDIHYHSCIDKGYEELKSHVGSHSYVETVKNPTYEEKGYIRHTCDVCGYYYDTEIDILTHNYSSKWSYDENNHYHTCTDKGYNDLKSDISEHSYSDNIVEPTYEAKGYTRHTCNICGYHYDDAETNMLTHHYSTKWSYDKNTHYHACTDEGYEDLKSSVGAHSFIDNIVSPTYETKGYTRHTCSVCGYYYDDTEVDVLPSYNITLDLNGGTSESIKSTSMTITHLDKSYFKFDLVKANYKFKGWEVNNTQVFDKDGNIVNEIELEDNLIFKAIFDEEATLSIYYTFYSPKTDLLIKKSIIKPNDIGDVSETASYPWNSYIDLRAYPNEGYVFDGWYYNEYPLSNEVQYKYMMWDTDVTMEARFKYKLYDLEVHTNKTELGEVLIRNAGNTYKENLLVKSYYTEEVTIAAHSLTETTRYLGWYNENNELVSTNGVYKFEMINRNYSLEAKWNKFDISYDLDGGVLPSGVENPSIYDIDMDDIELNNPIREGYTFVGWYFNEDKITEINTENKCDMLVVAKWNANTNTQYKVEHYLQNLDDDNYPDTPSDVDNLTGTTDTLTNGEVNTYEGFTSPSITQVNINGNGNTVIKLYYTRNSYTVALNKTVDKAGTITGAGTYKYGKKITIKAAINAGYTFVGWYKDNVEYTTDASFDYEIGSSNVVFEARYTINKYTITIDNQAVGVTISGITSGNAYEYDSQITLAATNTPSGYTIKWERSDDVIYVGDNYVFKVPATNITITTTITRPYTRNDNKIYFGRYPQIKVTDDTLINELNSLAGTKPTATNKYNWTDYNYYISSNITSFMFYQDIDYDNNGDYDYRGVFFTQYRPDYCSNSSSSYNSNQDDNGYSTSTIYWFSYDPIEWNILSESNGKALIIANLILDSQDYYPNSSSYYSFSHNGGTGYASNYELSNIRKFLNENFYNTAFNDLQKGIIETTTVDNSASSTGSSSNSYACKNTKDKMFLLSYKESNTYYNSSSSRVAKGTDYAKSQGLYVSENSVWWLRSPFDKDSAYYVYDEGYIYGFDVNYTGRGVRPACYIIL